jgi:hypothetical protein
MTPIRWLMLGILAAAGSEPGRPGGAGPEEALAPGGSGLISLGLADFDDGSGACDLDGWTLATDTSCYSNASACLLSDSMQDCCDNFACPIATGPLTGSTALVADRADCSLGTEQWLLDRTFDTTGLTDTRVCFDYAASGATADELLQVEVDDGASQSVVYCDDSGPRALVDDVWHHQCVDLPAFADDASNLTLRFFLQSSTNGDRLYLDNVDVQGWGGGCPPDYPTALADDFAACAAGWTALGSPVCGTTFQCDGTNTLSAEAGNWTIERLVDASELDDQVVLCFDVGDNNAGAGESVVVLVDAGAGYFTAWSKAGNLGANNTCGTFCVNLSNLDPAVHNNPSLGLRFALASDSAGQVVGIDNVQLSGARNCGIFADGFETGNTNAWSTTVP